MILHKGYVKPTAWESMRMNAIRNSGCILSMLRKAQKDKALEIPDNRVEIHHLKDTTHTMGHAFTICLDVWYHQGRPPKGMSCDEALRRFGAPLTAGRKTFFASHRLTERDLYEETNRRMGMATPWPRSKVFKREAQTEADVPVT